MKHYRKILAFCTEKLEEVVNITSDVKDAVRDSGISEGIALIFPLHTSSAVFINDSDPGITDDWSMVLDKLVPQDAGYIHDQSDPKKNAHGHMRSLMSGHHVCFPVTDGRPDFGTYHTVYYIEFDGKREKEIVIKIIGD